jgi:anaerobic selenocysteine-containing dehydrogenase
VLPGTDAAVALAMIAHLERIGRVDHAFLAAHTTGSEDLLARARAWPLSRAAIFAGVEASAIAAITEAYAEADPAVVRCGWGVERNRNGEAAVAAILALPALAGKFGKAGGGYALSSMEAYGVNWDRLAGVAEAETRWINMSQLGRALLEEVSPPIQMLFIYDANPAVTLPDQHRVQEGLLREDLFTVVFDQVMTDTAAYADILLPATTFLEQTDLHGSYGTYGVMLAEPVIAPQGESKPNDEVFRLISRRMGFPEPHASGISNALESLEATFAGDPPDPAGRGAHRLERLRREGILRFDFPGERPIQFRTVFPRTADRLVHLWPEELGADPYRVVETSGTEGYPLALISPATDRSICSILAEVYDSQVFLEMHPEDARSRGLREGEEVRVFNGLGEVRVALKLATTLRPGVVHLPKGIWNRHTRNGVVGTALVPDFISPISGGACFNDARVEVASATG